MADPLSGLSSASASSPMGGISWPRPELSEAATAASGKMTFQDLLTKSFDQAAQLDRNAQTAIEEGLSGGDLTQAEVFTSMKKADLALRTMLQIRNKVLDAYQEVQQMRM